MARRRRGRTSGRRETAEGQEDKETQEEEVDKPAPDETIDPADEPVDTPKGGIFHLEAAPSIRFGSVFRIDFEEVSGRPARVVRRCADSTVGPPPQSSGIKGNLFKQIEYEVEQRSPRRARCREDAEVALKDVY
jgi:hypothetical protein